MKPLVVTYWTNDAYKGMADRMLASARGVGLETKGYYRENPSGTWQDGDCAKPEMVMRAITENPGRSILFVDADCSFLTPPELLYDSAHDRDLATYFESPTLPTSTVLWFRAGAGLRYATRWLIEMKLTPNTPNDMFALTRAVQDERPRSILHLPPAYCWTEQWMRPRFGAATPVIEHFAVGEHTFPIHTWAKSKATIFKDKDDRG
jgi:hypothetical protein